MGFSLRAPNGNSSPFPGALLMDVLSLPVLTASVNNFVLDPSQIFSTYSLVASLAINITGLADGLDGRTIKLRNDGNFAITLTDEDAASTEFNRFLFGADVTLARGQSIELVYDSSLLRWIGSISAGSGTASGPLTFDGTISPAQITANTNDYAPAGFDTANVVRISFNATMPKMSGLSAAGIADGSIRVLENIGNTTGLFTDQDADSAAANRFAFGGDDVPLFPGESLTLVYDLTSARWRPLDNKSINLRPPASLGFHAFNDWLRVFDDGVTATLGTVTPVQPNPNGDVGHPGFLRYTSAGAGSSSGLFSWSENFMRLGNNWFWRFKEAVRITTLSTAAQRFIQRDGFLDNGVAATIDGAFFRYSDNLSAGNWQCVCIANSVETAVDSGVPVVAGTWYALDVRVYPAGNLARFFINGVLVASITTNIPTAAGRETGFGGFIAKTVGATARTVDSDYFDVYGYANQAR